MNPQPKKVPTANSAPHLVSVESGFDSDVYRLTREAQLGWVAGFLDGEGCIHIARHRYRCGRSDTYLLSVTISQNDRDTLEYFRAIVGIDARIYETKRCENHRRQCYALYYTGKRALQLIVLLAPYLRRKRREAQAAQAFFADGRVGENTNGKPVDPRLVEIRVHYFNLMKRLK